MSIYKRALEHYGVSAQVEIFIEECAELIADIQRFKRGRIKAEGLAEECADVKVVLKQLCLLPKYARPLVFAPRPDTLDASRFVIWKAMDDIVRCENPKGPEFLSVLLGVSRATGFIANLAGPENVESEIERKIERLERRIASGDKIERAIQIQDCNRFPRSTY